MTVFLWIHLFYSGFTIASPNHVIMSPRENMSEEYKTSEAQRRASRKYEKENMKLYSFRLSKNVDGDMIEYFG